MPVQSPSLLGLPPSPPPRARGNSTLIRKDSIQHHRNFEPVITSRNSKSDESLAWPGFNSASDHLSPSPFSSFPLSSAWHGVNHVGQLPVLWAWTYVVWFPVITKEDLLSL